MERGYQRRGQWQIRKMTFLKINTWRKVNCGLDELVALYAHAERSCFV